MATARIQRMTASPRKARLGLHLVTVLALGVVGASACSGGSATRIQLPTGKQEPAGSGQQPAGGGQEPTGGSGQEPGGAGVVPTGGSGSGSGGLSGSSSGSSSGGSSSCLDCTTYSCQVTLNGQTTTLFVTLIPSSNGGCYDINVNGNLACGGQVLTASGKNKGAVIGSWQPTAGGGFTASGNGESVQCAPLSSSGSSSGGVGAPGTSADAG